jgi:hypothetical protein
MGPACGKHPVKNPPQEGVSSKRGVKYTKSSVVATLQLQISARLYDLIPQ